MICDTTGSRGLDDNPLGRELDDIRRKNPRPVPAFELDEHEFSVGKGVHAVHARAQRYRAVRGELALRVDELRRTELCGEPGLRAGGEASLPQPREQQEQRRDAGANDKSRDEKRRGIHPLAFTFFRRIFKSRSRMRRMSARAHDLSSSHRASAGESK